MKKHTCTCGDDIEVACLNCTSERLKKIDVLANEPVIKPCCGCGQGVSTTRQSIETWCESCRNLPEKELLEVMGLS